MDHNFPDRPRCRTDLVSSQFAGEYVVVDAATGQAHSLSGEAAQVWRCIEAGSWPPALPAFRLTELVSGLTELGLLESVPGPGGLSRRALLAAGAAGGAALGLAGVTSIALPSAAMATSSPITFHRHGSYTLNVPAGATFTFALSGAGGGGGGDSFNPPVPYGGSKGGTGASISGSLYNGTGSSQTLDVVVGGGGPGGGIGGGSVAGGSSAFSAGGSGGPSVYGEGAGGGGGGASAILLNGVPIVVAGAGAGGGGGGQDSPAPTPGGDAETVSTAGVGGTAQTGGNPAGGGGGGGSQPGSGGVGGTYVGPEIEDYNGGAGGTGGSSYFPSTPVAGFTLTLAGSVTVSGGGGGGGGGTGQNGSPGGDGSAVFLGGGIST